MIERYAGKGISRYKIVITDKSIPSLELNKNISKNSKVLIITDSGIPKNYIKALKDKIKKSEVYTHIIKKGETSKSFSTYIEILTELVKLRFSRTDMIIAFGGGVVGDIAGFVASSYLRGINYIQIPTTLLSQVDSSVGGKTAINIPEGKNLVGAFYNPKLVLISTKFLQTLTDKEYKSGLGEVLKYALIDNRKLKILLEKNSFKVIYESLINFKSDQSPNIQVDYTGGLLIDYEEVASVSSGASFSGLLSFVLVAILLWIAFKDLYLLFSIVLTIVLGLVITLGITTLVIGSLNLISVAFAVLFIGLSVDYGIQICSRIKEKNFLKHETIKEKTKIIESVGKILFTASIPSIVGFLSFIPTDYVGLSELGIISAIGLVVGLILNTFFLPCLLGLFLKKKKIGFIELNSNLYENLLINNKNKILIIFFIIVFYSFFNLSKITFDSDALNLKDQELQSVKLAKELIENNPTSDYIASIIFTEKELKSFKYDHPIFQNDIVSGYFSYEKIFQKYESEDLDYLKFLLSNKKFEKPSEGGDQIARLSLLLDKYIEGDFGKVSVNAKQLKDNISLSQSDKISYLEIEEIFFAKFDDLISGVLNLGSIPDNLSSEIPENFSNRYISDNNLYRVEIFPSRDLSKPEDLKEFVSTIETFFPSATGMPIVQFNAGEIVIDSFKKALIISLFFLILFLFLIFRKMNYVLVCVISLVCAFILTIFFMIVLKLNFNFANMIAIPLLFSLGVSYQIYFIKRFDELGDFKKLFSSNTPLAILFSGLTTIFSFSTLFFSSHNGTSSMGLLLFISLSSTLITSLILLPIFIKIFRIK